MGKQLQFYLTEEEARRLYEISSKQCRRPHEQARFIVLSALGMVNSDTSSAKTNNDTTRQGTSVAVRT